MGEHAVRIAKETVEKAQSSNHQLLDEYATQIEASSYESLGTTAISTGTPIDLKSHTPNMLLQLQRTIGNRAVHHLISRQTVTKSPKQQALDLLENFKNEKNSSSAFTGLDKANIISGAIARIDKPELINQEQLNVCGPAAAAYILASSNPIGYAKVAIDLFKYGKATLGTFTIQAGSALRGKNPHQLKLPNGFIPDDIDWMILSSMRDDKNVSSFEGTPDEEVSGITMPRELVDWLKNLIGFKLVNDETNLFFTKNLNHISEVNKNINSGYYTVLFINANMLLKDPVQEPEQSIVSKVWSKIKAEFPDHFVVLKEPIIESNGKYTLNIYTWGSIKTFDISRSVFANNYYGAIFAK